MQEKDEVATRKLMLIILTFSDINAIIEGERL